MRITTLAYIENDDNYLMLHRNKDINDYNYGKWLGIGGKLEEKESIDEGMKREVYEETGLSVNSYDFKGMITFINTDYVTEHIFIYTIDDYSGIVKECDEGTLCWIPKNKVLDLDIWYGDKYFLKPLINNKNVIINIKFEYDGDELLNVVDNTKIMDVTN